MSSEKVVIPASPDSTVIASDEPPTPTQGIIRTWSMGSYPKLSNLMGSWPDFAIFRRFGSLNAQNLLFLQAEITHLEHELRQLRAKQEKSEDLDGILAQRCWMDLSKDSEDGEPSAQWAIILDIREKLKEYNESLLQYRDICALSNPTKRDLTVLRRWLVGPRHGDNFLRNEVERDIFHADNGCDEERSSDLVSLSREAGETDFFSRWIKDNFIDRFHEHVGHFYKNPVDEETGMYYYRGSHLRAVSHFVGVMLASIIPAASIFTLYFIEDMIDRLGVILAYSCLFSLCLAIFTSAKRVEIFAATAAFASVQVVFVGSTTILKHGQQVAQ